MSSQVLEGVQTVGTDEEITYSIKVSPPPAAIVWTKVLNERTDQDVTALVMPDGTTTFNGSLIILPELKNLVLGHAYRIECLYEDAKGNKLKTVAPIVCE